MSDRGMDDDWVHGSEGVDDDNGDEVVDVECGRTVERWAGV